MKAAVLEKVLSASTAVEILTTSLRHFDLCVADDNYAVAKRFGQIGYKAATLTGNTDGIGQLRERAARLSKLRSAFDAMKPSIAVLKSRPDDVAANRKVGEFFCFKKDNWNRGIPFLVAGDHPAAKLESTEPEDAKAKKQIGDLWWAEAEQSESPEKENLKRRAGKWYTDALPGLKGLSRVAVEKRLRETPSQLSKKEVPIGPVVSKTDANEAQRVVAEFYRDDYANAKTAADKSALAKRILQTGRETKDDPAVRSALLSVARDTAALAGDAATGFAAIEELAKHQQVDSYDMKATLLATVIKSVRRLDGQRALIPRIGTTFEQAIADGEIDAAKRLGNLAASIMRRTKDYAGERKVKARIKGLQSLAKDYEAAKAAEATLRTRPSDPAANLALGRFLCFIKGDWDQGLKKLALGNDPVLKRLAEQELAHPADAAGQVKLGDGWWELSESADSTTKERIRERAADWYQKTRSQLTGLTRARVEKRLDEWRQATLRNVSKSSVTNSIGMKLVKVPAGEFVMGSGRSAVEMVRLFGGKAEWYTDEHPQHRVRLNKSFYLGVTEVTQGQWQAVMGTMPWKGEEHTRQGVDNAANYVSWDDATEYCRRLSKKDGRQYRLPTEAEWEYACRAGRTTMYNFGDDVSSLKNYAWFNKNAAAVREGYAHKVGQKRPNAWGLYDMHGNVWEWCADRYGADYYGNSAGVDPSGPSSGSPRVLRGGSWSFGPQVCRSAERYRREPTTRFSSSGFRVVCELD
jgi:formylglycine-generating enzyme required for sulfatase activity